MGKEQVPEHRKGALHPAELGVAKPFPPERGAGIWEVPIIARGERKKGLCLAPNGL